MKKFLSFTLVIAMLLSTISINVHASKTPSDWAVEEVKNAAEAGIITDAVTKNYQKSITREEFSELVVKLYEKIASRIVTAGEDVFTDTDNSEVLKAYRLGIVKGVSDNEFAPKNKITRQEICVMLARCIDVALVDEDITKFNNNTFADESEIASWAIDYVNYAYDNEIMKGVGNNCIDPLGNVTCEQAILLAQRIYAKHKPINVAYEFNIKNAAFDEETGISYVNNIVIIFFNDFATREDKNKVVEAIDGEVVGQFDTVNQYQVKVQPSTLDELKALCDIVNGFDCVESSDYDLAMKVSTDSIVTPDDPWDMADWDEENPAGRNWWLEAIQAPSAWKYNDKFEHIKIGIVDEGFDLEHEDLKSKISIFTKTIEDNDGVDEHGTHVAGIIGASANNKKGITGIVWNSELICYACNSRWITEEDVFEGLIIAVKSGAKVVNVSLGMDLKNSNSTRSQAWIDKRGKMTSKEMAKLLSRGYDFVVVQSAGNGAPNPDDKDHNIGVDAIYNGYFCSITKDNCYTTRNIDADDILDRIIVVAAVGIRDQIYLQTKWTNGGKQVDICAPGDGIYSTVVDGYDKMNGTSMAAPMVTGVAALVWAANSSLTGAEVKAIVCDPENSTITVADNPNSPNATGVFNMVNAKLCVEKALKLKEQDSASTNGSKGGMSLQKAKDIVENGNTATEDAKK